MRTHKRVKCASEWLRAWMIWMPLLLVLLLGKGAVYAQTGGGYDLSWSTVDGGGEVLADGGAYRLLSTTGQPEAESSTASGGDYALMGGFWPSLQSSSYAIYLPVLLRGYAGMPDLTIDDLAATVNGATVTIRNAGNASTIDTFWVDVYFNPSRTPDVNLPWEIIAPAGIAWGVTKPIAPGETLTLISGGEFYSATHSTPLPYPTGARVYAYVDPLNFATDYGAIRESNEENNLQEQAELTAVGEPSVIEAVPEPIWEGLPER